ncbi:hypothetical protein SAMN05414139_03812 [Burkholderia sp. D7]|nr:hypothetical protein SAMN05414139_03812 [Burkholderia sp. D7]
MPTESLTGRRQETYEYVKDTVGLFNTDRLEINARLIPYQQTSIGAALFSRHIETGNRAAGLAVERLEPIDKHRHVATHRRTGRQRILTRLIGTEGSYDTNELVLGYAPQYRPALLQSQLAANLGYERQLCTVCEILPLICCHSPCEVADSSSFLAHNVPMSRLHRPDSCKRDCHTSSRPLAMPPRADAGLPFFVRIAPDGGQDFRRPGEMHLVGEMP